MKENFSIKIESFHSTEKGLIDNVSIHNNQLNNLKKLLINVD